jgi:hypothetical protein
VPKALPDQHAAARARPCRHAKQVFECAGFSLRQPALVSIRGVGGCAAFGYLKLDSVGSRFGAGQRKPLPRFESGTSRKRHYGSQLEGVRASIDKKAGKLQNYRSVCRSVDGRGSLGARASQGGRSISVGQNIAGQNLGWIDST